MASNNQVTLTFAGDSRDLERAFSRVGSAARGMDNDMSRADTNVKRRTTSWTSAIMGFGAAAAVGLAGVGVAAVSMGMSMVKAAEDSQKVGRQTTAVIKSMGAASWTSAAQVGELAEKISLKTGLDDEMIQSGENVLLTFRNVRNEVGRGNDIFDRATIAATDMSVALGQDLQSSVTQIGKALNDPIAGISALTRVGIQFTDQQKEQIAAMVESGDVMGAQKLILGELEAQFAGSAEAQATASDRMQVAWDNLQETLGTYLLPYFERLTTWITEEGIPKFEEFAAKLNEQVVPALSTLKTWVQDELVPALQRLWQFLEEEIIPVYQEIADEIMTNVLPATGRFIGSVNELSAALLGTRSETKKTGSQFGIFGDILAASVWGPNLVWKALSRVVDVLARIVSFAARAVEAINRIKPPGWFGDRGASLGDVIGLTPAASAFKAITGRASGGPVTAGKGYIVGEEGPEYFQPGASGTIIPHRATMGMAGAAAGGTVVNMYVQGSIRSDRELVALIRDQFDRGGFR